MIQQSDLIKLVGASMNVLGFECANQSCLKTKLRQIQCNNSTALRDAVVQGNTLMLALFVLFAKVGISDKYKFIHIVLTDGDDNSSNITQSKFIDITRQTRQQLPENILKTIYIGVDLQNNYTATNQLNEIVREGGNNTELHQINSSSIQDIFEKIQVNIGVIQRNQALIFQHQGQTVGIQRTSYQPVANIKVNNFVVLFTLDVSGSMSGSKWNQVCQAVDSFLDNLENTDIVLGIVFNNEIGILKNMNANQWNTSSSNQTQNNTPYNNPSSNQGQYNTPSTNQNQPESPKYKSQYQAPTYNVQPSYSPPKRETCKCTRCTIM